MDRGVWTGGGQGRCVDGGCVHRGVCVHSPMTATAVGSMLPTGMHTCLRTMLA